MPTIQVRGLPLRYALKRAPVGSAHTILFLNGIGSDLSAYEPLAAALVQHGFGSIRLNLPGIDGASLPWRMWHMRDFARLIDDFMAELALGPVVVLGYSWGGALAQEFARRHPDRVERLILLSTSAGAWLDFLDPELYCGGRLPAIAARNAGAPFVCLHPAGLALQLAAAVGWTSAFWASSLRVPTLVLAGDRDPLIPLANARFLARRLPLARLHVLRGGDHLLPFTRTAEVAAAVAAFLHEGHAEEQPRPPVTAPGPA